MTTRRWMIAVVAVGLSLVRLDAMRVYSLSSKYRRKAESAAKMERRCREIDAMDPVLRAREAAAAFYNPLLDDPAYNRRMIGYFAAMKIKYSRAADNPHLPVLPDPPPR
jgi:hypothetical protein